MNSTLRVVVVIGALCGSAVNAQMLYDQGPPLHRIVHKNTIAVRVNPLGLLYDGRFSYRLRLYESESKSLRDNFLGVGIAPTASPAFLRVGPYVEFNPLTVLGFWAKVQFVQYFGSFDLAQGFAGAQSVFSDSAIRASVPVTVGYSLAVTSGPTAPVIALGTGVAGGATASRPHTDTRQHSDVSSRFLYSSVVTSRGRHPETRQHGDVSSRYLYSSVMISLGLHTKTRQHGDVISRYL
jgi:hypothetical protein